MCAWAHFKFQEVTQSSFPPLPPPLMLAILEQEYLLLYSIRLIQYLHTSNKKKSILILAMVTNTVDDPEEKAQVNHELVLQYR